jgi:hypothetical protein
MRRAERCRVVHAVADHSDDGAAIGMRAHMVTPSALIDATVTEKAWSRGP